MVMEDPSQFPDSRRTQVVCAIITDDSGRVLVAKRPLGKQLELKWEFPGGKVDECEDPKTALAREIREELGVQIEVADRMDEVMFDYDFGRVQLTPYRARIVQGEIKAIEHAEVRWVSPRYLCSLDWAPADIPIMEKLATDRP